MQLYRDEDLWPLVRSEILDFATHNWELFKDEVSEAKLNVLHRVNWLSGPSTKDHHGNDVTLLLAVVTYARRITVLYESESMGARVYFPLAGPTVHNDELIIVFNCDYEHGHYYSTTLDTQSSGAVVDMEACKATVAATSDQLDSAEGQTIIPNSPIVVAPSRRFARRLRCTRRCCGEYVL